MQHLPTFDSKIYTCIYSLTFTSQYWYPWFSLQEEKTTFLPQELESSDCILCILTLVYKDTRHIRVSHSLLPKCTSAFNKFRSSEYGDILQLMYHIGSLINIMHIIVLYVSRVLDLVAVTNSLKQILIDTSPS